MECKIWRVGLDWMYEIRCKDIKQVAVTAAGNIWVV
jgi:hypothetical protein